MRLIKKRKFVLETAKEALDKLSEVSKGSEFKIDIKPFKGMKTGKDDRNKFLVVKKKGIWYLRIC